MKLQVQRLVPATVLTQRQYYLEGTGPLARGGRGGTFPTKIRPLINVRSSASQSTARVPTFKFISRSSHRPPLLSPAVSFSEQNWAVARHKKGANSPLLAREEEGGTAGGGPHVGEGLAMLITQTGHVGLPSCPR